MINRLDDYVTMSPALGARLTPPVLREPPSLAGVLGEMIPLIEQLDVVAEQYRQRLDLNSQARAADPLDHFTLACERARLLTEFALTSELLAHMNGWLATSTEVLGS